MPTDPSRIAADVQAEIEKNLQTIYDAIQRYGPQITEAADSIAADLQNAIDTHGPELQAHAEALASKVQAAVVEHGPALQEAAQRFQEQAEAIASDVEAFLRQRGL